MADNDHDGLTRKQFVGRGAAIGGALVVGPALAACGSTSTSSSKTSTQASGTPKHGGSLTMGVSGGGSSESYDPQVMGNAWVDISRALVTFAGLTRYTDDIGFEYALAEEFIPKSPTVWQIRLKQGVEFQNGKTVDADDVIYSIARIQKGGFDGAQLAAIDTKRMKKLDARTVELHLTKPDAILPLNFATPQQGIIPAGWSKGDKVVGAGPFVLKSFSPGQQSEHTRFANYYDTPRPYLDSLTIRSLPDDTARVNALLSGAVDMIDSVPAVQLSQMTQAGKAVYSNAKTSGGWEGAFVMNCSKPPFNDPKVRQAFRLLANRKQLVEQVLAGGTIGRVANDVFGVGDSAFIGETLPQREYDAEQAKALLTQAGHSNFTVNLNTAPFAAGVVNAATVFKQNVAAANAGVTVNLVSQTNTAFLAGWPNWPFFSTGWEAKPYLVQCATSVIPTAASAEPHFNDPEWLSLYNQAVGTVDETKRNDIIHQMMHIDYERGAYIIWGFSTLPGAHNPNIQGLRQDVEADALNFFGRGASNLWLSA